MTDDGITSDGITPDMVRAAEKRQAAIDADRGAAPTVDVDDEAPKALKARKQTTR